MDWFRRNWPDLLIGIALVAVIAGIIATLITGGSFFPVGQTTRTGTPPAQSSTTAPGATTPDTGSTPAASTDASGPASTTTTPSTPGTAPSADAAATGSTATPATAPSAGAAASDTTPDTAAGGSASGIAVLPPSDDGAPASAATDAAASTPSTSAATTTTTTTTSPASSSGAASASAASASAGASTGPGSDAPFRISVGAFGQAENAQRQATTFRDAGYPVFTADQGNLTIVLVGPYASQSEAETVAARIRAGGFDVDPVIYRFRGEGDSAPAPVATAPSGGASAAASSSGATASDSAPAATPGAGRYLQAGAYGSADSAQPQKQRLESLGFTVTERTESGLIKLLIGPFGAERLQQAQSELNAAGIESFAR